MLQCTGPNAMSTVASLRTRSKIRLRLTILFQVHNFIYFCCTNVINNAVCSCRCDMTIMSTCHPRCVTTTKAVTCGGVLDAANRFHLDRFRGLRGVGRCHTWRYGLLFIYYATKAAQSIRTYKNI